VRVADNILELIGNTPIVRLNKLTRPGIGQVLVKLESFNPGASIKDRTALGIIEQAEIEGKLKPDSVIVEPTSGNTGIGLAMIAAVKGYRLVVVMPETMSMERRLLMGAFGAEVVLTPGAAGMQGAIDKAQDLVRCHDNFFMPQQFENPANPEVHKRVTAREILEQTEGSLSVFISTVGTGGTLTGIGEYLKEKIPGLKVVAVEPANSPVLSGGLPGAHGIQGIGAGFVPKVLNREVIDEIFTVSDEQAMDTTRLLAQMEGILVGVSSGAAVYAAIKYAEGLFSNQKVLCIAPDTGERYLSSGIFRI
jgi:cysteine synthase A